MAAAKEQKTKVTVDIAGFDFCASGIVRLFDGWKKVWIYGKNEDVILPELSKGDVCKWNV